MTVIKFETVKRKATEEFLHASGGFCGMNINRIGSVAFLALVGGLSGKKYIHPTKLINEWVEYGVELIKRWDVRRVKTLIELFPSCVPAHCRNLQITAEMSDNENADWVVVFGSTGQ